MRMTGQHIRGRGADRWTREEQAHRERMLAEVAGGRVRIIEIRDQAAQRAEDARDDRERRARAERRIERLRQDIARITGTGRWSKSRRTSMSSGTMTPAVRRMLATAEGRAQLRRALDAAEPPTAPPALRNASAALTRTGMPALATLRPQPDGGSTPERRIVGAAAALILTDILDVSPETYDGWLQQICKP